MLPGMELMGCEDLSVPAQIMRHVVRIESSFNPYAIGVVGGRLVRQPRNLPEALATVRMLERDGYNFSIGLAQVNRHNLARYGLASYERAFQSCPNLQAGSRILAECHSRSGGDWGKAFSCYYSGNFVTGYRHGYVQKVLASMRKETVDPAQAVPLAERRARRVPAAEDSLLARRMQIDIPPSWNVATAAATAPGPAPVIGQATHSPLVSTGPPVRVGLMGVVPAAEQNKAPSIADAASKPATQNRDEAFVF